MSGGRARLRLVLRFALAAVAIGLAIPAARLAGDVREQWAVGKLIRRAEAPKLPPGEAAALAERLLVAAERPGLSASARARRRDVATEALFQAGRFAEALPLYLARCESLEGAAPPAARADVLWHIKECRRGLPTDTPADLDELRASYAALAAVAPPVAPASGGGWAMPEREFAHTVEWFVRAPPAPLDPALRRALLDEVIGLRERCLPPPPKPAEPDELAGLAELLLRRGGAGDAARATDLFERAAGSPGIEAHQGAALLRLCELRYPSRADPRRAALVGAWLGSRPAPDHLAPLVLDLGLCYLASKQYLEAVAAFGRLTDPGLEPPRAPSTLGAASSSFDSARTPALVADALAGQAEALGALGRAAEAGAARERLRAEFADTPAGRKLPTTNPGNPAMTPPR